MLELNIEANLSNIEFNEKNNSCNEDLSKIKEDMDLLERAKKNFDDITDNKKLREIINQKVKKQVTKNRLIELLQDKIVVAKINNNNNNKEYIKLNI